MLCIQTGLRLGRIHFVRSYAASAAAPTEPLLLKRIRDDLKLAMRAKDRVRCVKFGLRISMIIPKHIEDTV